MNLHYISLPHLTIALIAENGVITDAPPIARWTLGKREQFVVSYFLKKGAKCHLLPLP